MVLRASLAAVLEGCLPKSSLTLLQAGSTQAGISRTAKAAENPAHHRLGILSRSFQTSTGTFILKMFCICSIKVFSSRPVLFDVHMVLISKE